ncbi:uncharacterized protein [Chelonus insularis]|nr:uncharacterized protein LOC118065985 isoform X2 [Chelonus insularis]
MELLESIYLRTPAYVVKDGKNENSRIELTQEDCRLKLEQWNRMFPGDNNEQARAHVVKSLIHIGRTDLANFIKRNKRLIRILNNFIKPGDLYLYNKYLPKRYSKRLLSQFSPERESNDDDNLKKNQFYEKQVIVNNSNSKSSIDKHLIKKEIANSKNIKSKELSTSQNKFQIRAATVSEDSKKSNSDEVSVAHWLIICIGVLLVVLVVLMILSLVFHYKTGKRILNAFMSKGRCDPRCKGYESFSRESESEWITDITPRRWRRSSSIPSLTLSTASTPERKPSKTQSKKNKKSIDEKKKFEKAIAIDKKKIEKKTSKKKKKSLDEDTMTLKEMKNIADNCGYILRKDRPDCKCCKCSVSKGNILCQDDACRSRRIKNLENLYFNQLRKKSTAQKLNTMKKKDTKAKSRKEKDQRKRLSSTETLTQERKDSKSSTPRTCIRASFFGSPKKRDSSLKERSPPREKLSPKEKSPKKLSMEPCTNETCGTKTSPRASVDSNQITRRSKFF